MDVKVWGLMTYSNGTAFFRISAFFPISDVWFSNIHCIEITQVEGNVIKRCSTNGSETIKKSHNPKANQIQWMSDIRNPVLSEIRD